MQNTRQFLRDVYEGIYFLSRQYESNEKSLWIIYVRFALTFGVYYFGLLLLFLGIKVVLYGPFKPTLPEAIIYGFGIYGIIYWYGIYPLLDTSEVDETVTPILKKKKVRLSIITQAGGLICLGLSITAVYFMYRKLRTPS